MSESSSETSSLDFLWPTHAAQEAWTAKLDIKASLLVAADAAVVTIAATAFSGRDLVAVPPCAMALGMIAVISFIAGGVLSLAAVFPLLGPATSEAPGHIYFGHIRQHAIGDFIEQTRSMDAESQSREVAEQVHAMATRNWVKHRLAQWAVASSALGICLAGAGAIGFLLA